MPYCFGLQEICDIIGILSMTDSRAIPCHSQTSWAFLSVPMHTLPWTKLIFLFKQSKHFSPRLSMLRKSQAATRIPTLCLLIYPHVNGYIVPVWASLAVQTIYTQESTSGSYGNMNKNLVCQLRVNSMQPWWWCKRPVLVTDRTSMVVGDCGCPWEAA